MNKFVYSEIENAISTIDGLTTQVKESLTKMSQLIEENINNPEVWKGERSSGEFLKDWKAFEEEFPNFISSFTKQSNNVKLTLKNLRAEDI